MPKQKLVSAKKIHPSVPILVISLIIGLFIANYSLLSSSIKTRIFGTGSIDIIKVPIEINAGPKEFREKTIPIDPKTLSNKEVLKVVFDLKGVCLLDGPASAITFRTENSQEHSIALSEYANNCTEGEQATVIPISDFFGDSPTSKAMAVETSFWQPTSFALSIKSMTLGNENVLGKKSKKKKKKSKKPKQSTVVVVPPATSKTTWGIQSVSSMKETKDRVCDQRNETFINQWVINAKELGANYVAVETPYENPSCGSSLEYTKKWINAVRANGLKVWHRHMPLEFEGIYDKSKKVDEDYIKIITNYIKANPSLFKEGDIFTPVPEPQNGGIEGVTYCSQSKCIFSSKEVFNKWLRDAIDESKSAFSAVGLGGKITVGYYGFDGFVAWGDNNPDWEGILEDATVSKMGNITIDHYPEAVGDTMENDLNELQQKYPNVPIIIGEWGTIKGGNVEQQVQASMQAAKRKNVTGFNYWHFGMGGNEALVKESFEKRAQFDEVQAFYKP